MATAAPAGSSVKVNLDVRGAAYQVINRRDPELVCSGPAGTGKSWIWLEKLHLCALKYAGMKGLMARKTLRSLTASGAQTYKKTMDPPVSEWASFYGGSMAEPPAFRYSNGSLLMLSGMDDPSKALSQEFDIIFVQQAEELTEEDWETLTTRLRNGVMPYQQIGGDCNPAAPTHWLKRRADTGQTVMLHSRHEDNPRLYQNGQWTEEGTRYKAVLDALTGVRRLRLRDGIWAAAEGLVYDDYDPAVHLVDQAPDGMRRYVVGADWGYSNPGVLLVAGVTGAGDIYIVKQVYKTGETIDWWIEQAKAIESEYHPEAYACDPSEPGFIAQFVQAKLDARKAQNEIRLGIQKVQERLAVSGSGRPRLFIVRGSCEQPDRTLVDSGKPWCLEQEMESYIWAKTRDGSQKELPVDDANHAADSLRYLTMHLDSQQPTPVIAAAGVTQVSKWRRG